MGRFFYFLIDRRDIFLGIIILYLYTSLFFSLPKYNFLQEPASLFFLGLASFIYLSLGYYKKPSNFLFFLIILGFFIIEALILQFSFSKFESFRALIYILLFLFISYFFTGIKLTRKNIDFLLYSIIFSSVILTGIGIFYIIKEGDLRLSSIFNNPNVFSGYLLLVLPITFYYYIKNPYSVFWSFVLSFNLIGFVFTFSRGGIFSFIFGSALFFAVFRKEFRSFLDVRKAVLVPLVALIFLFIGFLFKSNEFLKFFGERLSFKNDIFLQAREEFIASGLFMFFENFFTGVGLGVYKLFLPLYQVSAVGYSKYPHNIFIELISENGIFGFFVFLGILSFFIIAFGILKKRKNIQKIYYFIILGLFLFFIDSFFNVAWHFYGVFICSAILTGIFVSQVFNKNFIKIQKKHLFNPLNIERFLIVIFMIMFFIFSYKFYFYNNLFKKGEFYFNVLKSYSPASYNFKKASWFFENEFILTYISSSYLNLYLKTKDRKYLELSDFYSDKIFKYTKIYSQAYNIKGLVEFYKRNYNKAFFNFYKAISLDRFNNPDYYINLAVLYFELGNFKRAKNTLEEYLSFYPPKIFATRKFSEEFLEKYSNIYLTLANMYGKLGNINKKKEYVLKTLALYPKNIKARKELNKLKFINNK